MRLVIAILALGGAVIGCGSGAGPAMPPFAPFGNDPSKSSAEPAGVSVETPPSSGGGQTIAQLCGTVCARIVASCPTATSTNCVSGCEADAETQPGCTAQLQAFLSCAATAAFTCDGTSVDAPACTGVEQALAVCLSPGS